LIGDIADSLSTIAVTVGGVRWLRIAQREHYIAGSVTRFALRWWTARPANALLGALLLAGMAGAFADWWAGGMLCAIVSLVGPFGLAYKGRSSRLAWTRRLRVLAATAVLLVVALSVGGSVLDLGPAATAVIAATLPAIVDLALLVTAPIERRLASRFVRSATEKLNAIKPRVVAITGSYGKTSTKLYIGHLLGAKYITLTSPASYNNMLGLSRAINERLTAGTEIFVAEMGTYGKGEIRALCDFLQPEVAVITAIGPMHLERMGSLENIVEAKAEILERAPVGVLNVDDPRLAEVAVEYEKRGGSLIRCSSEDPKADVYVEAEGRLLAVSAHGRLLAKVDIPEGFSTNVACAVGVALAFDIPDSSIASDLASLPQAEHRQTVHATTNGPVIIDDTYNSNPAGSSKALSTLLSLGADGRRVVVTPGMVELGREQEAANEAFGRRAAAFATDVVIVGRTNRRALLRGARNGSATIVLRESRTEAVAWVREQTAPGDVVLYENDLPDHYP
jgi:UDP-N-acetylmuramoyl-tripeptide--D-alanyl-D-alanine ligase